MATSLEELLAEEGFRRHKAKMMPRASFGLEAIGMPFYPLDDRHKPGPSGVRKTQRTRSDIPRYHFRGEFLADDELGDQKSRDIHVRQDKGSKKGKGPKHERRGSQELRHVKKFSNGSSDDLPGSEISSTARSNEIIEVGGIRKYDDIHSNDVYSPEERDKKYGARSEKMESPRQIIEKNKRVDKKKGHNSNKTSTVHKSLNETSRKSRKKSETSSGRSNRSSQQSKSLEDSKSRRKPDIEQSIATPALDVAAVQALISILNGYVKCFIRDEDFRALHRQRSFASVDTIGQLEGFQTEGKVIANLEEAIETVERAAEERATAKALKKASLQLSVIAGLNSNDLKDGFTSGIPNNELSACAHFYLSVVYKLQKKDRIAAKHLLQVFVDSPFQARNVLLPDLWEHIFLPHLSELKVWYGNEANFLLNSPTKTRKLKLLEKVYNEILDSGTYQFAVYYKDWLTEGVEAPLLPSIQIPSIPFHLVEKADLDNQSPDASSPASTFLPQTMVSKTLYDSVFRHSVKPAPEVAGCEEESFDISARSSHDAAVEENSPSEIVKRTVRDDAASYLNGALRVVGAHRWGRDNSSERHPNEEVGSHDINLKTSKSVHICTTPPAHNYNQLIVSTVAKAVFEQQQAENPINAVGAGTFLTYNKDVLHSDFLLTNSGSAVEGLEENCGYFIGGTSFLSIPQDFICPLTEMLFDEPVTLETGQTFERSAIIDWFGKGNTTCPVTGKILEYRAVPLTNFILKRVIVNWKKEHSRNLLDLASQIGESVESKDEIAVFILEQLVAASSQEDGIRSTKQLISLGGLQFLIRRFQCGDLEERTRVSALLLICILADPDYRNHVARNIDKLSLLELLHSRQLKSKRNAVSLLTQLICLNRRKDAKCFLEGLQKEETKDALHVLLVYLQSCLFEERPLVAVLLLHLDLMVEPQEYSAYREEAVDAITVALESSLTDEKVRMKCCRALLILGGHFSFGGKVMTEDWILKQAGFLDGPVYDSPDNENNILVDESIMMQMEDADEEKSREKWLMNLSASLLGDGHKSFLAATARCLVSENSDLVRVCLTTVAWLSSALVSLSEAEFQLSAFSALITGLKGCLENELVEHKILASMSLLNFSKFPECRLLLMTMAEDIAASLQSLTEVTWTAKELYSKICTY
ncbi:putative E3 ubiquitin-protein ligase LIN-1 isoform X1 [Coffea arabica]|uniref:RING-type E3 ubiquitin transferase n=1 Tax=Coffea arabica TaxID=13443 RepID=A0ABM4UQ81_COFAR